MGPEQQNLLFSSFKNQAIYLGGEINWHHNTLGFISIIDSSLRSNVVFGWNGVVFDNK